MGDQSEHSIFGPSGLPRGMRCTGSYALVKRLIAEGIIEANSNSDAARIGTVGHKVSDDCLKGGFDAAEFIGVSFIEDGLVVTVDEEFAEHVQTYLDLVRATPGEHFTERRYEIDAFPIPGQFGTADFTSIDKATKTLYVSDLKFGQGHVVYATENEQLMAYGLGVYDYFSQFYDIENVVMRIIQPRRYHVDEWSCSVEYLEMFRHMVRISTTTAWEAMNNPNAELELNPGELQCMFCRAQMHCEARKQQIVNIVSGNFENLEGPMKIKIADAVSRDTVLALYPYAAEAKKFLSRIEAEAVKQHVMGEKFPGYKLVRGRKSYKWNDEGEASGFLSLYLDEKDVYERKLASVAVAKKKLGSKLSRDEGFNSLVRESPGKLVLVAESDKREEVVISDKFEDLNFESVEEVEDE